MIPSGARPLPAAAKGWMGSARWWTEITRVTGGPDTCAMVAQPGDTFYDNFMSFGPFALNIEDRGEETRKFAILQFILGLISFWPPISFHARMWDNSLTYSRLENYFIGRVARDHPALYTIRSAHRQQLIIL